MTLIETFKKKPSLYVWAFFLIGVVFFMRGTLYPVNAPEINYPLLAGEISFAVGIVIGAILLVRKRKK